MEINRQLKWSSKISFRFWTVTLVFLQCIPVLIVESYPFYGLCLTGSVGLKPIFGPSGPSSHLQPHHYSFGGGGSGHNSHGYHRNMGSHLGGGHHHMGNRGMRRPGQGSMRHHILNGLSGHTSGHELLSGLLESGGHRGNGLSSGHGLLSSLGHNSGLTGLGHNSGLSGLGHSSGLSGLGHSGPSGLSNFGRGLSESSPGNELTSALVSLHGLSDGLFHGITGGTGESRSSSGVDPIDVNTLALYSSASSMIPQRDKKSMHLITDLLVDRAKLLKRFRDHRRSNVTSSDIKNQSVSQLLNMLLHSQNSPSTSTSSGDGLIQDIEGSPQYDTGDEGRGIGPPDYDGPRGPPSTDYIENGPPPYGDPRGPPPPHAGRPRPPLLYSGPQGPPPPGYSGPPGPPPPGYSGPPPPGYSGPQGFMHGHGPYPRGPPPPPPGPDYNDPRGPRPIQQHQQGIVQVGNMRFVEGSRPLIMEAHPPSGPFRHLQYSMFKRPVVPSSITPTNQNTIDMNHAPEINENDQNMEQDPQLHNSNMQMNENAHGEQELHYNYNPQIDNHLRGENSPEFQKDQQPFNNPSELMETPTSKQIDNKNHQTHSSPQQHNHEANDKPERYQNQQRFQINDNPNSNMHQIPQMISNDQQMDHNREINPNSQMDPSFLMKDNLRESQLSQPFQDHQDYSQILPPQNFKQDHPLPFNANVGNNAQVYPEQAYLHESDEYQFPNENQIVVNHYHIIPETENTNMAVDDDIQPPVEEFPNPNHEQQASRRQEEDSLVAPESGGVFDSSEEYYNAQEKDAKSVELKRKETTTSQIILNSLSSPTPSTNTTSLEIVSTLRNGNHNKKRNDTSSDVIPNNTDKLKILKIKEARNKTLTDIGKVRRHYQSTILNRHIQSNTTIKSPEEIHNNSTIKSNVVTEGNKLLVIVEGKRVQIPQFKPVKL